MATPPRQPKPRSPAPPPQRRRSPRSAQRSVKPPVKVKVLVAEPPPRRLPSLLLALVLLLGMGSLVAGGVWVGVRLMINPGSVSWLGWLLPESQRTPLSRYQTLAEVQAEAAQLGLRLGETIPLTVNQSQQILVPVFAPLSRCQDTGAAPGCQQIVELRVYRLLEQRQRATWQPYLESIDRLTVSPLSESFVVAPLTQAATEAVGSSRPLPIETLSVLHGGPEPGLWLTLSGTWSRGSDRIRYGQIVRYDFRYGGLDALLRWTSPTETAPYWQQVTSSDAPELVVNQSVGLEPDFQVYAPQPSDTGRVQLKAIGLSPTDIPQRSYEHALLLARHGLWTPALQKLQDVKQRSPKTWTVAAQAQLDVVALHAAVTREQAERDWASPNQAILADVIDGRWSTALQRLQSALAEGSDLDRLLGNSTDRIWQRVGAALSVGGNPPEVQAWGALIVFARQGREAAIAWLRARNPAIAAIAAQQRGTVAAPLDQVLNLLNRPLLVAAHPSRLIGAVTPSAPPNPTDWLRPQADPPADWSGQQSWYRIQVGSFHDGQRWQRAPFNRLDLPSIGTAQQLWSKLGLTQDPQIQVIVWAADSQPQVLQAAIEAAQLRDGELLLLARGDAPPANFGDRAPHPLAMTTATIRWLEPSQTTLAALHQQQPQWTAAFLPLLTQTTQLTHLVSTTNPADLPPPLESWSVRLLDLTENGQPEAILTVPPAASRDRPATLIFSDRGTLIYSEVGSDAGQAMMAIADPGDGKPALLVERAQTYGWRRWSATAQQFEPLP